MTYTHSHRCDWKISGECYCPSPGEEALRCGHLQEVGCECANNADDDYLPAELERGAA